MATPYATASGVAGFELSEIKSTFNTQTGWTNRYVYQGPSDALMAFLATIAIGYTSIDIEEQGPHRTVTLIYGGGLTYDPTGTVVTPADPISRVWTVAGNTLQKSLTEADFLRLAYRDPDNPNNYDLTAQRLAAAVTIVKEAIAKYRKAVNESEDIGTVLPSTYRALLNDDGYQRQLFDRLVIDDEIFETSQFVIQCVEEVTTASSIRNSYSGVDLLFTTSQLKVMEPTIDAASLISVDSIENEYGPVYWKKQAPTLSSSFGGKVELSRSYWGYRAYDEWRYRERRFV
jgi:hypothetical protein